MGQFFEQFTFTKEIDEDLSDAGVDTLNKYGGFAAVIGLVETKGQKLEYWLQMDSRTVYTILLFDNERDVIARNLREIKSHDTK